MIWFALDVSDTTNQADANLLVFGSGEIILIDAGETSYSLAPQLKKLGIRHVDKILVSHPHKDHYRGILGLKDAGIAIGAVHMNMPPKNICDREIPWGCDYNDLLKLSEALRQNSISFLPSKPGDLYADHEAFKLKVLYAHDGASPPVGDTDINDLSVILSLEVGRIKTLFTGDLNQKLGSYFATGGDENLKAQLLKVPHHGTESLAPNSFF